MLICFSTVMAAGEDIVIDQNLKLVLKDLGADTDGNPGLSEDEMAALSGELNLSSKGISELTGLEYAVNVESIDLSDNMVRDIGVLVEHIDKLSLTSLDVSQNYLDLADGGNDITDIQTLETAGCSVILKEKQKDIPVHDVALQPENADLHVGETLQLTAVIAPEDAANKTVSWSSNNESVVTVTDGLATAVGVGSAVITVATEDGDHKAQCSVTVTQSVDGVTIEKSVDMCPGDTYQLTAVVQPENATNQNVSFSSSNQDVITVADGLVTAVSLGSAKITVTTEDGGYTKQCSVNVVPGIISSNKYSIYMDKLWFAMEGTSAAKLIDELNNDSKYLSVHNTDGSEYTGNSVGTGMMVRLTVGREIKDEVMILTRGDANGDGKVSIADYTLQRLHILNLKQLAGSYEVAADLNLNGVITITDYTTTRLHILELHPITESYTPVNPGESVDPTNPNDPGYLATISNPRIRQFLETALAQQGDPYISGHEGPNSFDCSGLVHYCLRETGFTWVYRATAVTYSDFFKITSDPYDWDWINDLDAVNQDTEDWRWPWKFVSAEDMQPGDLMFYKKDTDDKSAYERKPVGHVGIYLGNGYHIHASSDYGQVIIGRFEGWYKEWFRFARRVNW